MNTPDENLLIEWFEREFERRTLAVYEGKGRIDWADIDTRVSFSELQQACELLGIKRHVVDFRLWWAEQRNWGKWMHDFDERIAEAYNDE